jgi:hypothetical protein
MSGRYRRSGVRVAVAQWLVARLRDVICKAHAGSTGLLPAIRAARLSPTEALWTL